MSIARSRSVVASIAILLAVACTSPVPAASRIASPSAPSSASASASPTPAPSVVPSPSTAGGSLVPSGSPGPSGSPSGSPPLSGSPSPDPTAFIIPSWEPWPAEGPGAPSRVFYKQLGSDPPVVALTIDDGLDPETCRRMFDYLRAERVPATFFPTLVAVHNDRVLWREIAAAGFPIGVHTLTHPDLTTLADVSVKRQLGGSKRRIENILKATLLPVFRPPYGAWDARVIALAGQIGLHTMVLWGPSAGDSGFGSPDPARLAQNAAQGHRGAIVLMHCNSPVSADALPLIVEAYRARGYGFVTIPQLLKEEPAD